MRSSWLLWRNIFQVRITFPKLFRFSLHSLSCRTFAGTVDNKNKMCTFSFMHQGGWESVIQSWSVQSWNTAYIQGAAPRQFLKPWLRTLYAALKSTPTRRLPNKLLPLGDSTTCHRWAFQFYCITVNKCFCIVCLKRHKNCNSCLIVILFKRKRSTSPL